MSRIAADFGLRASYHPHLTTIVESPQDVQRIFGLTDIAFCPDTGHLQAAGGDPVELIRDFRDRIEYVHLKDIDETGGFVPLGQGVLGAAGILAVLREFWLQRLGDGRNRRLGRRPERRRPPAATCSVRSGPRRSTRG